MSSSSPVVAAAPSAASTAATAATPSPVIHFFSSFSSIAADAPLSSRLVDGARGVLKSDASVQVLIRVRTANMEYVFARLPMKALEGKTAFDIYVPMKGRYHCFACRPVGVSKSTLRLTLESYGAWPCDDGAPSDKLVNVMSAKMWPQYLQA